MRRKAIPRHLRRLVRQRAHCRCEYCQHPDAYSSAPYACDHPLPHVGGAGDSLDDLAWSCPACNGHKASKTHAPDPKTKRLVPLFNPRLQKWSRHFAWSEDSRFVVGLTATGRATVEALCLNSEELVNLREVLIFAGKHPPQSSAE
ncbi:MAG: HNH endonuclease [Acidobacteria bacterium]|nr:HNH endonuclease [Acidobacteriota bacterium]